MMNALVAFTEAEGGSAVPFPPPRNLVEWAPFFGDGTAFEFNKIALISLIAFLVPTVIFIMARGGSADHPSKLRVLAEGIVKFIEEQVAKPGIGHGYEPYVPLLTTLFLFIAIGNLFEVIPFFNMPANARMAGPLLMALTVWVMFIAVGVKAPWFQLLQGHPVAIKRGEPLHARLRRLHRIVLGVHCSTHEPRRSFVRQHARRSHFARDLRRVDHWHLRQAVRRP